MKSGSLLIALICFAAFPVQAAKDKGDCLVGFGLLAETTEDPETLSVETYEDLLRSTLGSRLSQATLKKMVAAKDPFAIPEEGNEDHLTFRRHLAEFRRLLGEKQWLTENLRGRLLQSLAARITTSGEIQRALKENQSDVTLEGENNHYVTLLPGGTEAFTQDREPNANGKYPFYRVNLDTGKRTQVGDREVVGGAQDFHLLPDGSQLLFGGSEGTLEVVPVREGQPIWAEARFIGERFKAFPPRSFQSVTIAESSGPRTYVYATTDGNVYPDVRFDLKTGERVKFDYTPLDNVPELNSLVRTPRGWHVIPGTNRILGLFSPSDGGYRLAPFTIDSQTGAVALAGALHRETNHSEFIPALGKPGFYLLNHDRVRFVDTDGANARTLYEVKMVTGRERIWDVDPAPDGQSYAVLINPEVHTWEKRDQAKAQTILWLDPKQEKPLATMVLPLGRDINYVKFLPDGRLLLMDFKASAHKVIDPRTYEANRRP